MDFSHLLKLPTGVDDPTLWVLVVLVAFLGFLTALKVPQKLLGALDARADAIRDELESARRLREEAQEVLAAYQKRQREAEAEAKAIVEQARKEADALALETRRELADRLERRTAMAEAKIAQAEAEALANVRTMAADMAVAAARQVLSETVSATQHRQMIEASVEQLRTRL